MSISHPISNTNTTASTPTTPKHSKPFWGEDGFTFNDIIDSINPLQHIPIVSHIYRHLTGDEASNGARMVGGSLFGGVVGMLASFVDTSTTDANGRSLPEQAIATLENNPSKPAPSTNSTSSLHTPPAGLTEIADLPWLTTPQPQNLILTHTTTTPSPSSNAPILPTTNSVITLPEVPVLPPMTMNSTTNEPPMISSSLSMNHQKQTILSPIAFDHLSTTLPPELPNTLSDETRKAAVQHAIETYLNAEQHRDTTKLSKTHHDQLIADLLI